MAMTKIICPMVICALLIGAAVVYRAKAESPNVTVSVSGSGPTADDAKADAIRQALQLTLKQLVVVDRAISGDRLLRDRVMSTVNGYIDRYQQKAITMNSGQFRIEADISVSASRIENFIGTIIGSAGTIQGQTLLDEQNRRKAQASAEQQQKKARGEIFDRLLIGFPTSDLDILIKDMSVSPKDANIIDLVIEVSLKKTFASALEKTVEALSFCRWTAPRPRVPLSNFGNHIYFYHKQSCEDLQISAGPLYQAQLLPGAERNFGKDSNNNIACFYDSNQERCYVLQPGDYCDWCGLGTVSSGLVILGRFIDSQGQSANLKGPCVSANVSTTGSRPSRAEIPAYIENHGTKEARFDTVPFEGTAQIDSRTVDLSRAKRFVGIAAAGDAHSGRWLFSLKPDKVQPSNCEQLLDEAVQRYLVTAR